MITFLKVFVIAVALVAVTTAVFVWFGFYNVSARVPHWEITSELIEVLRDRSIIVHSRDIGAPDLGDPALPAKGAGLYQETCIHCHGAPGAQPGSFSQGLCPVPADLLSGSLQTEWNNAQMYWIVDNGIKLTGMPAFGSIYEKQEIAAVIAFLKKLPKMSPEQYRQMSQAGRTVKSESEREE